MLANPEAFAVAAPVAADAAPAAAEEAAPAKEEEKEEESDDDMVCNLIFCSRTHPFTHCIRFLLYRALACSTKLDDNDGILQFLCPFKIHASFLHSRLKVD